MHHKIFSFILLVFIASLFTPKYSYIFIIIVFPTLMFLFIHQLKKLSFYLKKNDRKLFDEFKIGTSDFHGRCFISIFSCWYEEIRKNGDNKVKEYSSNIRLLAGLFIVVWILEILIVLLSNYISNFTL